LRVLQEFARRDILRSACLRAAPPRVRRGGSEPPHDKDTNNMKVNGIERPLDVDGDTPVLWALRDVLGMTGTKFGCGMGLCGACTIHVDGAPTRACLTTVESVGKANVSTIESLAATRVGRALQKAWLDLDVVQCGYCQSGQLMSATALLSKNTAPSDEEIDAAMSGNVCRCGTYVRIRTGIKEAARALSGKAVA
jgi:isoquinoline 1-oxidoreductase alpha subunit